MEFISLDGPEWKSFDQMEASKLTYTLNQELFIERRLRTSKHFKNSWTLL